jgi:transposase-like protein
MKKPRFSEQQIAVALRQAEQGTPAVEVCRKLGVSEATFYAWKKRYVGMGVAELRRVRAARGGHPCRTWATSSFRRAPCMPMSPPTSHRRATTWIWASSPEKPS